MNDWNESHNWGIEDDKERRKAWNRHLRGKLMDLIATPVTVVVIFVLLVFASELGVWR